MIFDCFMFFNEEELLEIRLHELDSVVDKFVIVEAHQTFAGQDRDLVFPKLAHKWDEFRDKIIYASVRMPYGTQNSRFANRAREIYQRESIKEVLRKNDIQDRDVVLVSDMDEIPSKDDILYAANGPQPAVFMQDAFYYYVNNRYIAHNNEKWYGTAVFRWYHLKDMKPSHPCDLTFIEEKKRSYHTISSGWHFSYLGGTESVKNKVLAFAAPDEWGTQGVLESLEARLSTNQDLFGRQAIRLKRIDLDEIKYPKYLLENQKKFSHLIMEK